MENTEVINYNPAIITATTAFVIWMLGQFFNYRSKYVEEQQRREAILKAFHAEICFNKSKLDVFIETTSPNSMEELLNKIKVDKDLIPHIAEAKHTMVYEKNVAHIHVFDSESIGLIIEFYGSLQRIRSIIDGLYLPSYKSISNNGRSNVIRSIFVACDNTSHVAALLLECLERKHNIPRSSRLEVTYKASKFGEDYLDDLSCRLNRLDKNLQKAKDARASR